MQKQLQASVTLAVTFLIMTLLAACGDATSTPQVVGNNAAQSTPSLPPKTTMVAATTASASQTTTTAATTASTGQTAAATVTAPKMPGMPMATPGNDPMTVMLKPLSGAAFEVSWLQLMIVHHQGAVEMAKLVKTNTKRAELTKLADDIISAQTKEIDQMTKWLAEWHNAKPSPVMAGMEHAGMDHSNMTMGMADMGKLKMMQAAEFDKMFVAMMIEHHQQAVSMAALLPEKTKRTEFLALGEAIIKAQTGEIEQMKNWQQAWAK